MSAVLTLAILISNQIVFENVEGISSAIVASYLIGETNNSKNND